MLTNAEIDAQIEAEIKNVQNLPPLEKMILSAEWEANYHEEEKMLKAMGFETRDEIIRQSYADEGITLDIFDDEVLRPAVLYGLEAWKEKPRAKRMDELMAFYHEEANIGNEECFFDQFDEDNAPF